MALKKGQDALYLNQRVPILRTFDEVGNEISWASLPDDFVLVDHGGVWQLCRVRDHRLRDPNPAPGIDEKKLKEIISDI